PAYGPQNDVTLKMPAFEWVHVQLHQQKGMISLSPPTICNSALSFTLITYFFNGSIPFETPPNYLCSTSIYTSLSKNLIRIDYFDTKPENWECLYGHI
ncbi:hypothetical protein, partial [Acinetobacter sp. YH12025]